MKTRLLPLLRAVVVLFGLLVAAGPPSRALAQACPQGRWLGAFNWNNQAVSPLAQQFVATAGLIPRGPHRGKVVFFGQGVVVQNPPLAWHILDLGHDTLLASQGFITPQQAPPPAGDLICGAATWTEAGRWVVAGGMTNVPSPLGGFQGGDKIFTYDPDDGSPDGTWHPEVLSHPTLAQLRYYPSVVLMSDGRVMIAGGSNNWNAPGGWPSIRLVDTYEVFTPGSTTSGGYMPGTFVQVNGVREFDGPHRGSIGVDPEGKFSWFPRLHLLSNGEMFVAGKRTLSSSALHNNAILATAWNSALGYTNYPHHRFYGSSVLFPAIDAYHEDTVMIVGGFGNCVAVPDNSVEFCKATLLGTNDFWPTGGLWTSGQLGGSGVSIDLGLARGDCNATILPDASILVTGGRTNCNPCASNAFVSVPELFQGGAWSFMADQLHLGVQVIRDHHAVAILLPSGRVLSAFGNCRNFDFQIFEPPYICMPRPSWHGSSVPADTITVPVGGTTPIDAPWFSLPAGTSLGGLVLIRPASLTHHSDLDQRYVKLTTLPPQDPLPPAPFQAIRFLPPANTNVAPRGYYMLFLLTNTGVPSVARWVKLI